MGWGTAALPSAKDPTQKKVTANTAKARPSLESRWHVHIDSQTCGPYTGDEIHAMVAKGQITETDLVYPDGGPEWVQAKDDLTLRSFFRQSPAMPPPSPHHLKTFWSTRVTTTIGVFLFLGACWVIWPYYSFYRLAVAFRTGDVSALESGVAWDSVRQGLRADINAAFLPLLSANNGNNTPGAAFANGLVGAFAPAMVNSMVDGYVTPQAIATLSTDKNRASENGTDSLGSLTQQIQFAGAAKWDQLEYMFFSEDPLTFKVKVRPQHNPPLKSPYTLVLTWSGRWRLSRIILPSDPFEDLVAAAKQNLLGPKGINSPLTASPAVSAANQSSEANKDNALQKKKQDYIQNLQLYDFKAGYHETLLDGRTPGVEFKIKNNGTETLTMVKVTVYFKDVKGNTIAEEDYTPVLVSDFSFSDNKPLKPNYIWQLERGKFYTAKSVPSEWKDGAAEIRITDIRFEGEPK